MTGPSETHGFLFVIPPVGPAVPDSPIAYVDCSAVRTCAARPATTPPAMGPAEDLLEPLSASAGTPEDVAVVAPRSERGFIVGARQESVVVDQLSVEGEGPHARTTSTRRGPSLDVGVGREEDQ